MGGGEEAGSAACTHLLSLQKMELVLVPLSAHGNFYEGDCYVILSVSTILPPPPHSHKLLPWEPDSTASGANQAPGIHLAYTEQASSLTIKVHS